MDPRHDTDCIDDFIRIHREVVRLQKELGKATAMLTRAEEAVLELAGHNQWPNYIKAGDALVVIKQEFDQPVADVIDLRDYPATHELANLDEEVGGE